MNLSQHFTLDELTHTDFRQYDNTPNESEIENLKRAAALMEQVRALLGSKPITVNSGFRSKSVNDAVGSKDTSQHRIGCAVDFRHSELTPDQVVRMIVASDLPFDQVIREFDRWTHISVPNTPDAKPRRQALIIDRQGTRPYA